MPIRTSPLPEAMAGPGNRNARRRLVRPGPADASGVFLIAGHAARAEVVLDAVDARPDPLHRLHQRRVGDAERFGPAPDGGGVADIDVGLGAGVVGGTGFGGHCSLLLRAASAAARTEQPSRWSLTRPMACMNAYTVVGPTKVQPRRFRSLARDCASGGKPSACKRAGVTRLGRVAGVGSKLQTWSASE